MHFIDTHAHIYLEQFKDDLDATIKRAISTGVQTIYLPNIDGLSIQGMLQTERLYPEICHAMMGLHPCSVNKDFAFELEEIEKWFKKRDFVAIGETGIDLYWDKTFIEEQREAFTFQIELAKKLKRPIVIHSRESLNITIELIAKHHSDDLKGIFHCFNGSSIQAKQIAEMGFYMGIGGVVSYKNGGLDKVLTEVGPENFVLETDSPYLAPNPHRGKRNEPSFIPVIAQKMADFCNLPLQEIAKITTQNAMTVYHHG
ncbi:MAG: TatD family hydrolase [Cyclobacteriaceae bacterium]